MLDSMIGSFYGALVGDALGVPYEFHFMDIPPRYEIEMQPPVGFNRAHSGTPIGTWSDDGALMLALTASLAHNPSLELDDFAKRMCNFWHNGEYAVDRRMFDIGFQTQQGLAEFEAGTPASLSGGADVRDNGNGSLMRVLPVAYLVCDDKETARVAMEQGLPTHRHVRSQLVCALYVLTIKNINRGLPLLEALSAATKMVTELYDEEHHEELELILNAGEKLGTGTGYVVDSFWSAFESVMETDTLEDALKYAISLGNDTDTTACVAGGLAGALYGYNAIPERWLKDLRGTIFADDVLTSFIDKVHPC